MIGMDTTAKPTEVETEMEKLPLRYNAQMVNLSVLAKFHARYESIHPFQDGNGRTGRMILFQECLKHRISPVMIEDAKRSFYLEGLKAYREKKDISILEKLFREEQDAYYRGAIYFMEG